MQFSLTFSVLCCSLTLSVPGSGSRVWICGSGRILCWSRQLLDVYNRSQWLSWLPLTFCYVFSTWWYFQIMQLRIRMRSWVFLRSELIDISLTATAIHSITTWICNQNQYFLVFSLFGFSVFPCFYPKLFPKPHPPSFVCPSCLFFRLRLLSRRHHEWLLEWQSMVEEQTPNARKEERNNEEEYWKMSEIKRIADCALTCIYLSTKMHPYFSTWICFFCFFSFKERQQERNVFTFTLASIRINLSQHLCHNFSL